MAKKIDPPGDKPKKKLVRAQKKCGPLIVAKTNGRAIKMLEEASSERSELGKQHRKSMCRVLGKMYSSAQILANDPDQWFDFTRHPKWEGKRNRPHIADQQDAFDFVARFYVGFNGKSATKKVSLIKRALRPAFDERVSATEIPRLLRKLGGISGLAQKHRNEEKAGPITDDIGDAALPMLKISWKAPSPEFIDRIVRFSERGELHIAASTEVREDGRIFLTVIRVERAPKQS